MIKKIKEKINRKAKIKKYNEWKGRPFPVSERNIVYGELLDIYHDNSMITTSVSVKNFNNKGVFVGRMYKLFPYSKLYKRKSKPIFAGFNKDSLKRKKLSFFDIYSYIFLKSITIFCFYIMTFMIKITNWLQKKLKKISEK